MKHLASAISAGLLLAAAPHAVSEQTDSDVSVQNQDASAMTGTYVGPFGKRKITVCLDRVIGNTVTGYSIVAGNERAFSGSWKETEDGYDITAKEPGDHPADGTFIFTFVTKPKSIRGQWKPNDKKIGVRKFKLPAREFKYNPNAGKYPQSSTKTLSEKDVENMKPEELRIMRNEIYARHGYGFKMADMREYFDKLNWYMPIAVNVTTKLTPTEQKNAKLIKRYEKYSAEFYDSFGR
jgi:hypothetical protein